MRLYSMNYLIYISAASKLMTDADLIKILADSRGNNKAKNITGMLLYGDGTFIQVLEGDEQDIADTYSKIEKDPRHKRLTVLATGELTKRNFPTWSMGFISTNAKEMDELDGYINPKNKNFLEHSNPHAAITVLKTFAQNNNIAMAL